MKQFNGFIIITLLALITACGGNANTENSGDSTKTDTTKKASDSTKKVENTPPPKPTTPRGFLAQKWAYDAESFANALVGTMPAEKRNDKDKETFKNMAEKAFYQFNADGSYVGQSPAGLAIKGKWGLSSDNKILTIREDGVDRADIRVIEELTIDKLVWKLTQGEQSMSFAMIPFANKLTSTTETK